MSLPENYINVGACTSPPIDEDRKLLSLPNSNRLTDNRSERSVDDFLNGIPKKNSILDDVESNSGSVTLKEENSRHSSLLSRSHSEIPCDLEDDINSKPDIENNNYNHTQTSEDKVAIFPEDNYNLNLQNLHQTESQLINSPTTTNKRSNDMFEVQIENSEKIATPTISFIKKVEHCPPTHQDKDVQINAQKSTEYEEFINKLSQMTFLIQQKDEEIKKLSEKLQNFVPKNKTHRKSSSSPSSSSSEESDKSSKEKVKPKKEKKTKKKSDAMKQKEKSKIKKQHITEDTEVIKSIDKDEKKSIKNKSEEKQSKWSEEANNGQGSGKDNVKNFKPNYSGDISKYDDETKMDLRKKLDELELEIRRLQQANVDSILSFQMLENKDKITNKSSNDSVINKLLVEHDQLKDEIQQLKWEHSKLTQPGLLMEEINHLKKDMDYLRKQNDFLKNFTKQSSRSLNHLMTSSHDIREIKDKVNGKSHRNTLSNIPNSNNSSNNIYQKLQSNHRNAFDAPNMQNMLKKNIESLESPYHTTYQSIQHSAPFSNNPSYRARKLSDSSSVLMEDVKLKTWIETVPKNYKTTFNQFSSSYQGPSNHYKNKDFDEESVDSYVSVTTSVTERSEDNWRQKMTNQDSNHDFLSTQESELSDDNTVKEILNFPAKSKLDYSFTPKTPTDLNLEDFVKFVRPGGKMSTGRVCFIGHLPGRNEVCVGLELGEDAGKHDGMFEGHRYFQCRKNRGVFISFHKIILAYKPF